MAQKKAGKQPANLNAFYWLLGLLAVAGIAAIALIVLRGRTGDAALEPVPVAGAENPQELVKLAKGVTIGSDNAPLKMLVFSDFGCPHCGDFAARIEPMLVSEYVNTGKLQFVYYDFPLGGGFKHSFLAARAARCAGDQNKFWEYHDLVFGKQSEWAPEENAPVEKFVSYGEELGLNRGQLETCVKSNKYQDIVSANRLLGEQLRVNSTPTMFVNGRRLPPEIAMDIKPLREFLDAELGGAAPAAATTAQ